MAEAPSKSRWKNPTPAQQAKYNLRPLPEDYETTKEEEDLLAMYEAVRALEREAAKIREQAAKDRLAAADAAYKQPMEEASKNEAAAESGKKKRPRKRKKKADETGTTPTEGEGVGDDYEEESDIEEEENLGDDSKSLHERREAKLAEMRDGLEKAKQTAENKEAAETALRAELLAVKEDDTGPSLKRKKLEPSKEKTSLIANIKKETPPHDFSEKLELKSWSGKVLFPDTPEVEKWTPPASASHPSEGDLTLELTDFDASLAQVGNGNNTIVIKFTAPSDSKRFSLNIAGPGHGDFFDVLFHFNPRHYERGGQLVVNDKQEGIWGQGIAIPLSQLPLIFGQVSCTLMIQINGDGFDVFLEEKLCCRLEHRTQLPPNGSLFLQFPSTDDYGNLENWSVYKVWWGNRRIMATGDLSSVAGVNVFSALHPRKLFVSGLPRISTEAEVDLRRAELERAFRKYGGDRGVIATVPTNTTFAFVELETERQADLALTEMQDHYRMNRARRSRHEVLQEERAAAEAAKQGQVKETTEWD